MAKMNRRNIGNGTTRKGLSGSTNQRSTNKSADKPKTAIVSMAESPGDSGTLSISAETGVLVITGYGDPEGCFVNGNFDSVLIACEDGGAYQIKVPTADLSRFNIGERPADPQLRALHDRMVSNMRVAEMQVGLRAGTAPWDSRCETKVIESLKNKDAKKWGHLTAPIHPKLYDGTFYVKGASTKGTISTDIMPATDQFGLFDASYELGRDGKAFSVSQPVSISHPKHRVVPLVTVGKHKKAAGAYKVKNYSLHMFLSHLAKFRILSPFAAHDHIVRNSSFLSDDIIQQCPPNDRSRLERLVHRIDSGVPLEGVILIGENSSELERSSLNRVMYLPEDAYQQVLQQDNPVHNVASTSFKRNANTLVKSTFTEYLNEGRKVSDIIWEKHDEITHAWPTAKKGEKIKLLMDVAEIGGVGEEPGINLAGHRFFVFRGADKKPLTETSLKALKVYELDALKTAFISAFLDVIRTHTVVMHEDSFNGLDDIAIGAQNLSVTVTSEVES